MRTHVFIDGFNLYYGLLKGSPHKWLNLEALCDRLLPQDTVEKIYYFAALVEPRLSDPHQPIRQQAYMRALATLPRVSIHLGTFLSNAVRLPLLQVDDRTGHWFRDADGRPRLQTDGSGRTKTAWFLRTEEKGSDVNLAAHLLRDAYRGHCECAVIVSNDSDLITPVRLAKEECGLRIGLAPPRRRGSLELTALADFRRTIRAGVLSASQFPNEVSDWNGTVVKPEGW